MSGLADTAMNVPPFFDDPALSSRIWSEIAGLEVSGGLPLLLRYQEPGGDMIDRKAGASWLALRLPDVPLERLLVCAGAQGALAAIVGLLAAPGDVICAENLTYPGFRALAAHNGISLASVEIDGEGIVPDSLDEVCRRVKPKTLYCTPTLHNPTTATMSVARREKVAAVARRHGLPIVEDDAYGGLPAEPLPPLAHFVPELTYYISGLAKSLSPALRIAYLVAPDIRSAVRLAAATRASVSMPSPLAAAAATRLIESGVADDVAKAIRTESAARQKIVRELLPDADVMTNAEAFHLWLKLPKGWTRGEFAARMRQTGIGVVTSDAFALSNPPEAVRIGLGASESRAALTSGLGLASALLSGPPELTSSVV